MSYGYPTTRRYPRTLADAWPREHAAPIRRYPGRTNRIYGVLLACALGLFLALLLVHELAK
jgi:hypothetical protein